MTFFATAGRSHVGHVRRINEDAILMRPDFGVWAVADGMGGHASGDAASRKVVERLEAIGPNLDADRALERARAALEAVNRELLDLGEARSPPRTMGATVVALFSDGRRFSCVWAGDSRAYRLRDSEWIQLTRDHSLVQQLVDSGLISHAEAGAHPDGHVVTRAVGADNALEADSVVGDLRAGDAFLLCSDGLSRLLSSDELRQAAGEADCELAADRLLATALERGAPDNVSLVLIQAR